MKHKVAKILVSEFIINIINTLDTVVRDPIRGVFLNIQVKYKHSQQVNVLAVR